MGGFVPLAIEIQMERAESAMGYVALLKQAVEPSPLGVGMFVLPKETYQNRDGAFMRPELN